MELLTHWLTIGREAASVSLLDASLIGAVLLAAVAILSRRRRPAPPSATGAPPRSSLLATVLTVIAAGIATAAAGSGMWEVFGHVPGMTPFWRVLLFAFIELSILTSAIRAREALRRTGSTGADGIAVWVLAALSGVIATLDVSGGPALHIVRLTAPLIAAWLWERGMAGERAYAARAGKKVREAVASRVGWRRIAVRLGLVTADGRALSDVERDQRIAAYGRAAVRVHERKEAEAAGWRISLARRRRDRRGRMLPGLGSDAEVTQAVRRWIAAYYEQETATSRADLADVRPWAAPDPASDPAVIAAEQILAEAEERNGRMLDHLAAMSERIDRTAAESRQASATLHDQLGGFVQDLSGRVASVEQVATEARRATVDRVPAPVGAYDGARRPGGEVPASQPMVNAAAPSSPSAAARPVVQGTAALAFAEDAAHEVVVTGSNTKERAYSILDQVSWREDGRSVPVLAEAVAEALATVPDFAKTGTLERYVYDWRAEVADGRRVLPGERPRLRSVLRSAARPSTED